VAGCGFRPVYGTWSAAAETVVELNRVAIEPIGDRNGQMLRNLLIDRFYTTGRPADPRYRLVIRLATTQEDLGIRRDATATRARIRLVADYELVDAASGQTVYRSFSRAVVSYNLLEAQYATLVSEQDAYDRGLTELSEDIRTRISLFFTRAPAEGAAASPAPALTTAVPATPPATP
jgi:LPS-assembly lipoprotein